MNIYLSVELAIRELDSKLLLATLAASKGHGVIVSEQNIIKELYREEFLTQEYFMQNL